MLKDGYKFEKYSVDLPYKEGDIRLNEFSGQWIIALSVLANGSEWGRRTKKGV